MSLGPCLYQKDCSSVAVLANPLSGDAAYAGKSYFAGLAYTSSSSKITYSGVTQRPICAS